MAHTCADDHGDDDNGGMAMGCDDDDGFDDGRNDPVLTEPTMSHIPQHQRLLDTFYIYDVISCITTAFTGHFFTSTM